MSRKRILGVSSDRADLGIVQPVWQALEVSGDFEQAVFLTGTHALDGAQRIALPKGTRQYIGGTALPGQAGEQTLHAMNDIALAASEAINDFRPDLLLVAGDRLDLLPAVYASLPFQLPVAHIAGGDLSFGAVDERIRHAITKLSHVHFVLTANAAQRLAGMGEEPWRIHIVGAPNLDTLNSIEEVDDGRFAEEFGFESLAKLRIVTIHPETNNADPLAPLTPILEALDADAQPTLFTGPNRDPYGARMHEKIVQFVDSRPWARFRQNLGAFWYANAMRKSQVMLGNSSSGIIEAGLFGLHVVNVGDRQAGRECGSNVFHCENNTEAVLKALTKASDADCPPPSGGLYGDGRASKRIAMAIENLPQRDALLYKLFVSGNSPDGAQSAKRGEIS